MTTEAIIMMIIGIGITWGGAALCLLKALKR
ncbi:MAG: MetS family NSS transporter small subunit [Proteobacteria bacterium]|nr:MetS family NSS transporter small subunit [Pseudomonadota bacterium]